ncbi:MAG: hypothetical protein ACJ0IB_02560 [Verrucomicrobiales bacterium]
MSLKGLSNKGFPQLNGKLHSNPRSLVRGLCGVIYGLGNFRIFFLTPYIYTAHLAQKNGLPPVGCLEDLGVAS